MNGHIIGWILQMTTVGHSFDLKIKEVATVVRSQNFTVARGASRGQQWNSGWGQQSPLPWFAGQRSAIPVNLILILGLDLLHQRSLTLIKRRKSPSWQTAHFVQSPLEHPVFWTCNKLLSWLKQLLFAFFSKIYSWIKQSEILHGDGH